MSSQTKKKIFQFMLDNNCLKFGNFTLKSGIQSNYYLNLRNLINHPEAIKLISREIAALISETDTYLCGLPYAGIPYANCISIQNNIPLIVLRKEKKKYGMQNMIDGLENLDWKKVILIDDIFTSGSSIQDSLCHFEKEGIEVIKTIVIIDRSEGKVKLDNVISLFKVEELVEYYQNQKKIGNPMRELKYEDRIPLSENLLFRKILKIMVTKKSNLAVSLDYTCLEKIIRVLRKIGEHIIMVKLHVDIIENFNLNLMKELVKLSQELSFFIFEDRKFSEIGNIFQKQYQNGIYKISSWTHLINFHLISGDSNVKVYEDLYQPEIHAGLLVAQMSNKNNFITEDYTQRVIKVAEDNCGVCGFISQEKISGDNFLYLTPGIRCDLTQDNKDQRYKTPHEAIVNHGTDIIIVGRGITDNDDVLEKTILYREMGWSSYLLSLGEK